jgi:hypothetical protein
MTGDLGIGIHGFHQAVGDRRIKVSQDAIFMLPQQASKISHKNQTRVDRQPTSTSQNSSSHRMALEKPKNH